MKYNTLIWADEFDGDALDTTKWSYQHGIRSWDSGRPGAPFWGNREGEYYTEDAVSVADGCLVITARAVTDADRRRFDDMPPRVRYISGRIRTRTDDGRVLASMQYGRAEARIRLPIGRDYWPAFWMLGVDGGWPRCGEIDIMEADGGKPCVSTGAIHYGASGREHRFKWLPQRFDGGGTLDGFHVYAVEWDAEAVRWFVDERPFFEVERSVYDPDGIGSFDQPFYLLLNLAVCGVGYVGQTGPDPADLPGRMWVDYVRLYQ